MHHQTPNNDPLRPAPQRNPRVGVLGATLGTGNLGVDALGIAMVQGLAAAVPNVEIAYQAWDHRQQVMIPSGQHSIACDPLVIRRQGSLRHRDGLGQMQNWARLRNWFPTQLPSFSKALSQLLRCDAILDVSAGDSFANIYGDDVFWYQTQIKLLCLKLGLPLILMPQTYGPFANQAAEELAASILSKATLVCSREATGIQEVEQLCGEKTPDRLIQVPDMALALEPSEMELPKDFLNAKKSAAPCIALNVSGLLYLNRHSFDLKFNFQELTQKILIWALSIPHSRVLLVPHVVDPLRSPAKKGSRKCNLDTTDTSASEHLIAQLDDTQSSRIDILPNPPSPAHAKYALSHCDFFIGARMHAFIGAISQIVPGALLAYSKKAQGLASLLGISESVVEMRENSVEQCVSEINALYQRRKATQAYLAESIPHAQAELRSFFTNEIAPLVQRRTSNSSNFNDLPNTPTTQSLNKVLS